MFAMKLKLLLFGLLIGILLGACSEKDEIPVDADDNFITSVVLSVNEKTYEAVIENNTITVTVPYTVSLDRAKASFAYTPSAKIFPDPATITDWNTERIFRVTSYNGTINDYTYVVVKDEIRSEGNVELKTQAEITSFAATGITIIKGDLIIGSDVENTQEITDITSLEILKEVEGNIVIRNNYNGGTLTGLDNVTSIGGLLIGNPDEKISNKSLEVISLNGLTSVTNDIAIYRNGAKYIDFKKLERVGGDVRVDSLPSLLRINMPVLKEAGSLNFTDLPREFSDISLPELETVNGDFKIISIYGNVSSGGLYFGMGNTELKNLGNIQKLSVVKGMLAIQNFEKLTELSVLNHVTQLGGIDLEQLPKMSQTLNLGSINFIPNSEDAKIRISYLQKLETLITPNNLSDFDVDIYASSDKYIKTNFTQVRNLSYHSSSGETVEFQLESVNGNFNFSEKMGGGISAPYLKIVSGYMHLEISMRCSVLNFPLLESIGGQFLIAGNLNLSTMKHDFKSLKTVCCNPNPQYANQGTWTSTPGVPYGGLDIRSNTTFDLFPALEHIGGTGLTIHGFTAFPCPKLTTIEGKLSVDNSKTFKSLDFPLLNKLSGIFFYRLSSFSDYSKLAEFIKNGQITENNWDVFDCGYNPTFQDMKEGRYTPAE